MCRLCVRYDDIIMLSEVSDYIRYTMWCKMNAWPIAARVLLCLPYNLIKREGVDPSTLSAYSITKPQKCRKQIEEMSQGPQKDRQGRYTVRQTYINIDRWNQNRDPAFQAVTKGCGPLTVPFFIIDTQYSYGPNILMVIRKVQMVLVTHLLPLIFSYTSIYRATYKTWILSVCMFAFSEATRSPSIMTFRLKAASGPGWVMTKPDKKNNLYAQFAPYLSS